MRCRVTMQVTVDAPDGHDAAHQIRSWLSDAQGRMDSTLNFRIPSVEELDDDNIVARKIKA